MPPELFWEGDVWLASAYYRASQLSIQRKSEEMWLQGLYNFAAVSTALGNALRKKGAKAKSYPQQPLRLIPYTEAERTAREESERQKAVEYFTRLEKKWNAAKCRSAKCEKEATVWQN